METCRFTARSGNEITKISIRPDSSDWYATHRPSGEKSGSDSEAGPAATGMESDPSALMAQTSWPWPGEKSYPSSQLPSRDDKVGVIVLTNTNDSNPNDIAMQLMSTVGEAVAKATAVEPKVVAWDPSWGRFAGLYRGRGGDSQVVLLNQRLVIITPNAPSLNDPVRLEPIGKGLFLFVAPGGGGPVGEVVRFVEEGGRVVRMIIGDSTVDRVRE